MLDTRPQRDEAAQAQRRVADSATHRRLHRHLAMPMMVQSGAFLGSFYLVEISLENLRSGNGGIFFGATLALGAVGEVIFLWMLIWSALAAFSSLTVLPVSVQQKLRQSVMLWGTGSAKRSLQKAAATTVITGSLLAGTTVAAYADDGEGAPGHLWPEITQTTQPSDATVNALESLTVTVPSNESKNEGGSESEQKSSPTVKAPAPVIKIDSPPTAHLAPRENLLPTNRVGSSPSYIKRDSGGTGTSRSAPAHKRQDSADETAAQGQENRAGTVDVPPSGADTSVTDTANAKKTYTVEPGDSLWLIASRYLGPTATNNQIDAAWRSLYAANQSIVGSNPDLIEPGQVLEIKLS